MTLSVRPFPETFNWMKKDPPECWWHHSGAMVLDWTEKEEEASWSPAFISVQPGCGCNTTKCCTPLLPQWGCSHQHNSPGMRGYTLKRGTFFELFETVSPAGPVDQAGLNLKRFTCLCSHTYTHVVLGLIIGMHHHTQLNTFLIKLRLRKYFVMATRKVTYILRNHRLISLVL